MFGMFTSFVRDVVGYSSESQIKHVKHPRTVIVDGMQDMELSSDVDGAPLFFGARVDSCSMCGLCAKVCRSGALFIQQQGNSMELCHNQSKCVGCHSCTAICPCQKLEIHSPYSKLAQVQSRKAVMIASRETTTCVTCGKHFVRNDDEAECDICQYRHYGRLRQTLF
jgi:formate hydrogenlyase subunit 6/NADH:ubiquinone oxidoreductase subunit I